MTRHRRAWFLSIAAAEVLFVLAGIYVEPTYRVRGALRGDATYENKPTSYWRVHCDAWLDRFDSPTDAAQYIPPGIAVPCLDDDIPMGGNAIHIRSRPQTVLTRLLDRFRSAEDPFKVDWPPPVLFGNPGTEPVLEELAREPKYELIAKRALAYAKVYRKMGFTQ